MSRTIACALALCLSMCLSVWAISHSLRNLARDAANESPDHRLFRPAVMYRPIPPHEFVGPPAPYRPASRYEQQIEDQLARHRLPPSAIPEPVPAPREVK